MPSNNSAPSAKRLLSGTVLLVLDEDVAKADNVFLIEVLARNADKSAVQVISQQWVSIKKQLRYHTDVGM